jgi:hypothetical protein
MGDLLAAYRERVAARVELNPKSRQRITEHCTYLVKTWPGFESVAPDEVTRGAVEDWRSRALT